MNHKALDILPVLQIDPYDPRIGRITVTRLNGGERLWEVTAQGEFLLVSYELWPYMVVAIAEDAPPVEIEAIGRDPVREYVICRMGTLEAAC